MKLATLRTAAGTAAVVITDDSAIEIAGVADSAWAPVVPAPGRILCAGLNYRNYILEMGRELPEHPTFFAKFPEALIGAFDPIELAAISTDVEWEREFAVIIGAPLRNATEAEAEVAIAGYAVFNDVSMRDFQYRTLQWLQGKTFENTTPFGPHLVTTDEWAPGPRMTTVGGGEAVQQEDAAGPNAECYVHNMNSRSLQAHLVVTLCLRIGERAAAATTSEWATGTSGK